MRVQSLGQGDVLEEEMATHSSILAWENSRTQKPGGLQSTGLQRVEHDWEIEHKHISTCVSYMQILHHFYIKDWASIDFVFCRGPGNNHPRYWVMSICISCKMNKMIEEEKDISTFIFLLSFVTLKIDKILDKQRLSKITAWTLRLEFSLFYMI